MSKKLLLADDSITIQKVIQITFSQEDYQLTITDNGDTAYAQAKVVVPDLVLADVYMPGRNGYELCAAIKQTPALRHVPVLLLAGSFESFDETKARAAGADDWIEKPFESQALLDKVAALLSAAPATPAAEPAQPPGEPFAAAAAAAATADGWSQLEPVAAPSAAALAAEDFIFEEIAASEANLIFAEEALPPTPQPPATAAAATAAVEPPVFASEEEILPLDDADILGGEDLEPVGEVVTLTPWSRHELPVEEAFPASEEPELSSAPPTEFSIPASEAATVETPGLVAEAAAGYLDQAAAPAAAATPVTMLSEAALERIVERAVVKAIGQLAGTTLERVAWEVVPDLAETLIKEEIRKIKESVG